MISPLVNEIVEWIMLDVNGARPLSEHSELEKQELKTIINRESLLLLDQNQMVQDKPEEKASSLSYLRGFDLVKRITLPDIQGKKSFIFEKNWNLPKSF